MTRELLMKIEDAEFQRDSALEIENVIISLSESKSATGALFDAYRAALISAEKQWSEIESRADFQAQYKTREDARREFLLKYFKSRKI